VEGVLIPLVTPFLDGKLDVASLERLLERYVDRGITGVVLLGTTGESPTVTGHERDELVARACEVVGGRIRIYVGISGNATEAVVAAVRDAERLEPDGYLVVCPYYNRPPQDGLAAHFCHVAAATERPLIVYNIPYRTGVNLANDTLLGLIETCPNIVAVKDSTGNLPQTFDLIARAPSGFSVLTGEDQLFLSCLTAGAAGGILASAHVRTSAFVDVANAVRDNDLDGARSAWSTVAPLIPLLFAEPNPMPVKHCLWRAGLISSPECRLPLTRVSETHARQLDEAFAEAHTPT
jgi:4-hydroxy-tetrahydrodipicolinate synthase